MLTSCPLSVYREPGAAAEKNFYDSASIEHTRQSIRSDHFSKTCKAEPVSPTGIQDFGSAVSSPPPRRSRDKSSSSIEGDISRLSLSSCKPEKTDSARLARAIQALRKDLACIGVDVEFVKLYEGGNRKANKASLSSGRSPHKLRKRKMRR